MTAVLTGYDARGQRWTVRCRLRPRPGESRRRLRALFERELDDIIASAVSRGCTDIVRVKGARYKSTGRYQVVHTGEGVE